MASELDKLLIRIEADTANMRRALNGAERSVDQFGSKVDRKLKGIESGFKRLGGVIGAVLAGLASREFAKFIEGTAMIKFMADAAGLSAREFQLMQRSALASGAAVGGMSRVMQAFVGRVGEAKVGTGEFSRFISRHLPELRSQLLATTSQREAYEMVTSTLQRLQTAEERAALIKAAFGDEALKFTNILVGGGEALKDLEKDTASYIGLVSDRAIRESAKFNAELTKMGLEFEALSRNIAGAVARGLTPFISSLRAIQTEARKAQIAATFDAVRTGPGAFETDQLKDVAAVLRDQLPAAAEKGSAAYAKIAAKLADVNEELERRKTAGRLGGFAQGAAAISASDPIQPLKLQMQIPEFKTSVKRNSLIEQAARARAQIETEAFERTRLEYENDLARFQKFYDEKAITAAEFEDARAALQARASEKIGQAVEAENTRYREQFDELEGLLTDTLTSAFDELFTSGKFSARTFFSEVLSGMAKIALQAQVIKPIMDSLFKQGGAGNGVAGILTTALMSGLQGFAAGGPVLGGKPIMVGEKGPEMFVPGASGRIMSNQRINQGSGSSTPTQIIFNIDGDATDATVEKMRRIAQQELLAGAPSIVERSVGTVAQRHRNDPSYLRR
jgi:hypothetical protein